MNKKSICSLNYYTGITNELVNQITAVNSVQLNNEIIAVVVTGIHSQAGEIVGSMERALGKNKMITQVSEKHPEECKLQTTQNKAYAWRTI